MKKLLAMFAIMASLSLFSSCGDDKKAEPAPEPAPVKEEVYEPKHQSETVDLQKVTKYEYRNAPTATPATDVAVNYEAKKLYTAPTEVKFSYANGDTYTYVIPAEFTIRKNQAGKPRVITDNDCTVWLQGQTKSGKFCEFVFFGNPKHNGSKVKPNSYSNTLQYSK